MRFLRVAHASSVDGVVAAYKVDAMAVEILIPAVDVGGDGQDAAPCASGVTQPVSARLFGAA